MRTLISSVSLAVVLAGVALAQPEEPAKPAPPDQPGVETGAPAKPAPQPVAPMQPAAQPAAPVQPAAPIQPTAPVQPGIPAQPAVPAPKPAPVIAPVYCGTVTCFLFRVPAQGHDTEARANSAMDVINKYLGGSVGKVTTKPVGKNIQLLLNNEVVALITPADAAAEKQKSVALVAARWSKVLASAFKATKAQP